MFKVEEDAKNLFEYTRALRRDFHRNPELAFREFRTSKIVARELTDIGLAVKTGVGKTGVVGILEGARPGPVVLLRFDMDALPIIEENLADYASCQPGIMHACGHDAHTAVGLSVAQLLYRYRNELNGTVKFMFQPGEEGAGGACEMISDGVLRDPKPDVAIALHVWNEKPLGWLAVADGPIMAAAESFRVRIIGRGGHGALPSSATDPILATAQVISALQSIVARNVHPLKTAVVSVTSVHGGDAFNVIPPEVEIKGTIRTFEKSVRERVLSRFRDIVEQTACSFECSVEIDLKSITPALVNDKNVTEKVYGVCRSRFHDFEIETQFQTMGSEDMAFVLEQVPGCFIFIGSANHDKQLNYPHHHPRFDIDESILPKCVEIMTSCALEFLAGSNSE